MRILCTFPGKFGDILWALATVKQIAMENNTKIDFMCMPQYYSLLPLIQQQSYIEKAFVDEAWLCTGSPHGDQPFEPQNSKQYEVEYDVVVNLGYRSHPGIHGTGKSLIDFIAAQQGLTLTEPVCPWIEAGNKHIGYMEITKYPWIAYSFNSDYKEVKDSFWKRFMECITDSVGVHNLINAGELPWDLAAKAISNSDCFIGCRSSNYVLAHAVAQKHMFIYEPHPHRNKIAWNDVFGNPHWKEEGSAITDSPEKAADMCLNWIRQIKENLHENVETVAG